ncbi:MAG TPA: hypothetical protein VGE74_05020 [Gemmata sp.]
MPPVFNYIECAGDSSPASASFTIRQQSAGGLYLTMPVAFQDMPNRLIDVLGYTGTQPLGGGDAGKINRRLPLRHPQYQWLFADSFRPRGVGAAGTIVTPSPGPGSAIIPRFPLYATYNCDISFSPRDYNSWQDKDVTVATGTGYDKSGIDYEFRYADEWMRFCVFELTPQNNFISAQQGEMVFRASGVGGRADPDMVQYQDSPRMYMPDSALKVKWFSVPYRYLTSPNSYLRKFIGHINQHNWGDQWLGPGAGYGPYPAGSLLYHGARPTAVYSNVVPDEGLLAYSTGGNGFARARLCDLELEFTYTARTIGTSTANTPPTVGSNMSVENRNRIVAGHNLLPWLTTRKFYYATTRETMTPTFNSFPFALLFTDPDADKSPILEP